MPDYGGIPSGDTVDYEISLTVIIELTVSAVNLIGAYMTVSVILYGLLHGKQCHVI